MGKFSDGFFKGRFKQQRSSSHIGTGFLIATAHNIYPPPSGEIKPSQKVFYPGVSGSRDSADGHRVIDRRLAKENLLEQGEPSSYHYAQRRIQSFPEQPEKDLSTRGFFLQETKRRYDM